MTEKPLEYRTHDAQEELTSPEGRNKLEQRLLDHLDGKHDQRVPPDHDQRRWAMMRITPDAVVQLASGSLRVSYPGPIPHGARVVGQAWAPMLQMFELIIEHESFDRVPVGAEAPALRLLTFEADAPENSKPLELEVPSE